MLSKDNRAMSYANDVITEFYTDISERRRYEAAERYILDRNSIWNDGLRKGKEEGISIGLSQGKIEIAKNMRSMGFNIDDIIKATGISKEKLLEL